MAAVADLLIVGNVSWEDIKLNHGVTEMAVEAAVVTEMTVEAVMMMMMMEVGDHCDGPSWEDEKLIRLWDPHFFLVVSLILLFVISSSQTVVPMAESSFTFVAGSARSI